MRRGSIAMGVMLLAAASSGCRRPPADAVAVYDGGSVSRAALDGRIAALPPGQRRAGESGDLEAWRASIVRELAVEQIVLAEIEDEPVPAEVEGGIAELRRQVVVAAYLQDHLPPIEAPTEEQLRAAYEEWLPLYSREEHRLVYHVFLAAAGEEEAEEAERRMQRLRERVLSGEDFSRLAGEVSESETRHRGGVLGWFARDQLDPRLGEVVFDLPLQEPSRPIRTSSGLHMLWVEAVTGGQNHSFDEVRELVERRLMNRRREEAARDLVTIEVPPGSFVPDPESLRTLLEEGDAGSLILRVGDFELRLRDLRRRLAELGAPTAPMDLIQALSTRELLYMQCRQEGCDERPQVTERVEAAEREALVDQELRRRLLERALADRAALEEYFGRNRKRYLEPVRWRLTRAVIPLGPEPAARMRRLEASREALDSGAITLEQLSERLDGSLESLGWRRLADLSVESPALAELVTELSAGGHSPPVRGENGLEIVRCDERLEPAPVAFERVEAQVARDFVEHEGQELYDALQDELLSSRAFRMVDR
ncbi:MAG: peptidyl-prolyl cis-trans isomerase [Thermoanaerobaculia bacterium]